MYDVIVIGSGPAGYTAALYTSRAYLKTALLAGIQPGGQLTTTTEVDNFPGFSKGILGPQLVNEMQEQVKRFGTEIQQYHVSRITYQANTKTFLISAGEKTFESRTVIVATGASAMCLGIPSEEKLRGKGVSACATCDGFFFRGKEVVVVGGGDTAMEEATFLTKFASKVTVIHRRKEFRASAIMLERAKKDDKIVFLTNKVIEEIHGETAVTGIRMKDVETGEVSDFPTQGVFLAIGHTPNTKFLAGFIDLDAKGYIQVNKKQNANQELKTNPALLPQTETTIPGVFAAGDCVDPRYRQAIVAAGQGAMAAIDAEKYLEEMKS